MDELVDRLADARKRLTSKDRVRDAMLKQRRDITAGAQEVVNLVHQDRLTDAQERYTDLLGDVKAVRSEVDGHPDLWYAGALRNALQEVAEAWAVLELAGVEPDLPEDLITDAALVLGLADTIGELRRMALDALIDDDVERARGRLSEMERLFEELRTIQVASGIVDHRHKVDVGRQLVDKTRGKITLGEIERRMRTATGSSGTLDPSTARSEDDG